MVPKTKEWAEFWFSYDLETGVVRKKRMFGVMGQRGKGEGFVDDLGYIRFDVQGFKCRAHNIAWLLLTGEWCQVDHKNGIKTDNKPGNLRKANKSQNAANYYKETRGLSVCSAPGKYRASITFEGKSYNLGRYMSFEEAKAAYNKKALEFFGEYARL
jgi:hypothetical protein